MRGMKFLALYFLLLVSLTVIVLPAILIIVSDSFLLLLIYIILPVYICWVIMFIDFWKDGTFDGN